MSGFLYGLFTILFLVVVGTVEGVTESGILMLVPAGGMYDPSKLWDADISSLVGVNDCPDDESLDVVDLALKGTFRSERMFNLSYYEDVTMTMHVYNDHGEEILKTGVCPYTDSYQMACPYSGSDVITSDFTLYDGFRLHTNNTDNTLVAIVNPRHYLSDTLDGVEILISTGTTLQNMPDPGCNGCYSVPSGTADDIQTNMNIRKCYEVCTTTEYFAIQGTSCFCVADNGGVPAGLTVAQDSDCSTLCDGDSKQLCGGPSSSSVFYRAAFENYVNFYQGLNATTELGTVIINSTSLKTFPTTDYVSGAKVVEEEECQLTNLYFDVQPPTYNLMVSSSCSTTPGSLHAVLDGTGQVETFGAVKSGCVLLEPGDNNYTFPRATISILGPSGDVVSVGGMFVIRGTWTIPESSSSILSSTESSMIESSSIDMSSSDEMSMTSIDSSTIDTSLMMSTTMVMSSSTPDIPVTTGDNAGQTTINPTATVGATAVGGSTAGGTAAGGSVGATAGGGSTAGETAAGGTVGATMGVTAGSTAGATAGATAGTTAGATAGATAGMTAGATAGATASATVGSGGVAPTTTPGAGTGGSASTPGPVVFYSPDGRLIYEACTCRCKPPPLKPNQTPLEAAVERAEQVSEELHLDTRNLSATIRRKESASDERPSASAGGYVACLLLSGIGLAFLLADALSIMTHLHLLKSNVSSFLGKA
ncbi:autotransporter adhesin BpaC-like [Haliotis cracherodii]|uniref:autotransporter adhesin BpaC-like n=1 Tax=Haliotis cracherodii TaxID=6455 RepID=UPI0039E8DF72